MEDKTVPLSDVLNYLNDRLRELRDPKTGTMVKYVEKDWTKIAAREIEDAMRYFRNYGNSNPFGTPSRTNNPAVAPFNESNEFIDRFMNKVILAESTKTRT